MAYLSELREAILEIRDAYEDRPVLMPEDTTKAVKVELYRPGEDPGRQHKLNGLTDKISDKIAKAKEKVGPDCLAWYTGFHFSQNNWGIYFKDYGILKEGIVSINAVSSINIVAAGYELLNLHESYHHLVEVAVTLMEIIKNEGLYRSYFKNIYSNKTLNLKDHPLEEALAEAWTFDQINKIILRKKNVRLKKIAAATCDITKIDNNLRQGPPGYRDFYKYSNIIQNTKLIFGRGERELFSIILNKAQSKIEKLRGVEVKYGKIPRYLCFTNEISRVNYDYIYYTLKMNGVKVIPIII